MLNIPKYVVTDEAIAAHVHIEKPCPDIVVSAGPCRSGTTFYVQVFAQSGFEVWRQPLKSILRGQVHKNAPHFRIANAEFVFVKETLGPTTNAASFNPIKILLAAGVPAEKIHFLVIARDPFATATSWIEQFAHFETRENLVRTCLLSYESIQNIKQYAVSIGIRTTTIVYDAWRDNVPAVVVQKLFTRIGYPSSQSAFSGWVPLKKMEAAGKNIYSIPQPDIYDRNLKSYYEKVNKSTGITYYNKPLNVIREKLSPALIEQIAQSRALQIYRELTQATELDLGIKIELIPMIGL
ncbi:MAG: hypothetical protein DRI56_07145 [Chloroflexota bacterium]|nr:MAG: hypothetical protein DRI56_07145 [Chloroflexota bacterium]